MTKKTVKDLDGDFQMLRGEFDKLKTMHDILTKKCEYLENKLEQKSSNVKCDDCGEEFIRIRDLRVHRKTHSSENISNKCDICDKEFNKEWKLRAHKKKHQNLKCDICNKTFNSESILEKHKKITHEKIKIYCHYFNNGLKCPFENECVFLHEDSELQVW